MVVDDRREERSLLRTLVQSHPELEWVGEAESAAEAVEVIREQRPDTVLLDVEMPGGDGFSLLAELDQPPEVVFVSAWPDFAVRAFAVNAVDYLVKPVSPARFAGTVRRLQNAISRDRSAVIRHDPRDSICLSAPGRTIFVPVSQIVMLSAADSSTRISLTNHPDITINRPLTDYDDLLPTSLFLRLDRSLIINRSRAIKHEVIDRNNFRLWMTGLSEPLLIGRTALERWRAAGR